MKNTTHKADRKADVSIGMKATHTQTHKEITYIGDVYIGEKFIHLSSDNRGSIVFPLDVKTQKFFKRLTSKLDNIVKETKSKKPDNRNIEFI